MGAGRRRHAEGVRRSGREQVPPQTPRPASRPQAAGAPLTTRSGSPGTQARPHWVGRGERASPLSGGAGGGSVSCLFQILEATHVPELLVPSSTVKASHVAPSCALLRGHSSSSDARLPPLALLRAPVPCWLHRQGQLRSKLDSCHSLNPFTTNRAQSHTGSADEAVDTCGAVTLPPMGASRPEPHHGPGGMLGKGGVLQRALGHQTHADRCYGASASHTAVKATHAQTRTQQAATHA